MTAAAMLAHPARPAPALSLPTVEEVARAVRRWDPALRRLSRRTGGRADEAYADGLAHLIAAVARQWQAPHDA